MWRFSAMCSVMLCACVGSADLVPMAPGTPPGFAGGAGGAGGGSVEPTDSGTPPAEPDSGVMAPSDSGSPSDAGSPPADAGSPPVDAGPTDPCAGVSCLTGARCVPNPARCECGPGYVADGGTCLPGDPGIPELRTQAQVCAAWTAGHPGSVGADFTKTSATCDPGVLSRSALDEALARLNMHRWLVGLGPVTDDANDDAAAQACSLTSAWNPAGPSAHNPAPTATCYTSLGAAGAGSSNIAWGCGGAADAIDQWMVDNGNETTFGHRRWLMNPPLDPVGIGFYQGGNNYGSASCIRVFGGSGRGPHPQWYAFPPPGFSPSGIMSWPWTVQGNGLRFGNLAATITRASDSAALGVTPHVLNGGYGEASLLLERMGWSPVVGETYRVHVTADQMTPIDYEVKPVTCP